jgi:hypothetical protein
MYKPPASPGTLPPNQSEGTATISYDSEVQQMQEVENLDDSYSFNINRQNLSPSFNSWIPQPYFNPRSADRIHSMPNSGASTAGEAV